MQITKDSNFTINIDNLIDFIFEGSDDRTTDSEITETYVMDDDTKKMDVINKQVREVKGDKDNSPKDTIRYDLFKTFLTILNDSDFKETGMLTLSESMVFNSLLSKNIIEVV